VDLAGLEFKGWLDRTVRDGGATTIASLPMRGVWRIKGSRVIVMRAEEPGVRVGCSVEERSGVGRLGETIQRMGRLL
jgi:hypothetical protein